MSLLLALQQLLNLSNERIEPQFLDRTSFQRFAGLKHAGTSLLAIRSGGFANS
ncbi:MULTISPECIES: hypothetical protein [Pseudomonas]|uniref:Transposase InsH N-terminal domain-containing protein n=1 Tax=Pseudomonas plecoglossicida TaxID=70775 RepID=A0ABX4TUE7_PSEDL|nr:MULTISPECIES: hypothetical protein [Pseudomonas]PLU84355.1 hypothetical protein CXG44_26535 [Pseudomonas plecoglossicida]PLU89621.1 hypothetical protein CXG45_26935 [Pseudomonas plecoglossicida]PLU97676.1 hypothetical protein CXG48_26900 [Pseudomonas plecoglossicida]PLV07722.1 hypothetical protein CXG47_27075 [Pseudomonas plecoglossicida]RFQ01323.1 hypothetical protein D0O09_15735 [Pseudomonas putida]